MKKLTTTNSKSLKKQFPQIYTEFFSKAPLIVSAPASFFWSGENTTAEGGMIVMQQVPLRVYVSVGRGRENGIELDKYIYFSRVQNRFLEAQIEESLDYKLRTFLKDYLNLNKGGLKISFLSEVRIGMDISVSAAFCSALAIALFIWEKRVSIEEVNAWANLSMPEIISNKNLKFDPIFRLSAKLRSIFHYDNVSSGASSFASLVATPFPIYYLSQPQKRKLWPTYWGRKFSHLDKLWYLGGRITELFHIQESPIFPIDFGILSMGKSEGILGIIRSTSKHRDRTKPIIPFLSKLSKNYTDKILPFKNILKSKDKESDIYQLYLNPLICESALTLFALRDLLTKGMNEQTINALSTAINSYQKISSAIGITSQQLDEVCNFLWSLQKSLYGFTVGAKSLSGISLSEVLFVFPPRILRDRLEQIIKDLSQLLETEVIVEYASWIDGFEDKGPIVEQHLLNRIYSSFISEGAMQIKTISSEELIVSEIYTRDKFSKNKKIMPLLLDCVEEKILIKGEEMTSKEIPSSKTAIKVLKILFENVGKEVKNSIFGAGSYFEDRNELQSKIITPLNKTLQRRLGKKLNITLSGGITEFTIKLSPPSFDIYLLEKTF